jgi:hypothetical protein
MMLGVVFLVWASMRLKHTREDLDREKRLAELNRLDARDGRLRKDSESS